MLCTETKAVALQRLAGCETKEWHRLVVVSGAWPSVVWLLFPVLGLSGTRAVCFRFRFSSRFQLSSLAGNR